MQNILYSSLLYKSTKIKIYLNKILSVVLYGSENWSLVSMEERRLKISDNTMLRRIFGPERGEVAREWRKQHNEEL